MLMMTMLLSYCVLQVCVLQVGNQAEHARLLYEKGLVSKQSCMENPFCQSVNARSGLDSTCWSKPTANIEALQAHN